MLGPASAAVDACQNLRIMADRPAAFIVDEIHCREQLPGGDFGLGPGAALVIGIEDVPTITDRHQTFAGMDHIDHQAFAGLGGFNRKYRLRTGIAGSERGSR